LAPPITGGVLGGYERIASREIGVSQKHTQITTLADPKLRAALEIFANALTEPLAVFRSLVDAHMTNLSLKVWKDSIQALAPKITLLFEGSSQVQLSSWITQDWLVESLLPEDRFVQLSPPVTKGSDDAVTSLLSISSRLGLPIRDVVEIAGISRSSFYSWRSPTAPRPRLSSQGRLWELAQLVEDLEELIEAPLRHWLLANPQRRTDLLQGNFHKVLDAASPVNGAPFLAPSYSTNYAVGGDEATQIDDSPARGASGKIGVAATVHTRKRRGE